jgi:AcrR family transcriptional regulator
VTSSETRPKRKYELKQRAKEMAETRRRITEAAVELHGTVGPARTTWSAIAKRAGVQRHTLYRHFPTEPDLFGACSAHYLAANPWPDHEAWREIADPRERLNRALDKLYAYYERTEPMFSNVMRDVELVEALHPTLVPLERYLTETVEVLADGWPAQGASRLLLDAALRYAVDFQTWRSLTTNRRISRREAVVLVTALVEAAATSAERTAA